MLGGRAFVKPLPFKLGTNGGMLDYGIDSIAIADAQAIGMSIYRNDVPWNYKKGNFVGMASSPGAYNAASLTTLINVTQALQTAGFTPLFVVTVNQNPALCPTVTTALASGSSYTSLSVSATPFAINVGDTITLTNPSNQAQTQTVTASAAAAKGATLIAVNSFTANANYATGTWVYDTAWVPCTPQHLADLMVYLVSQPQLKGLHWELLNEPDGVSWGVSATLLTQAHQLAYPAMKAADPTCVVHGICIENLAPLGYPEGTTYYNSCVDAGILGNYDVLSFHQYGTGADGHWDCAPDAPNAYGKTFWQMIANFRANMIAKGDTSDIWCTEFGWTSDNSSGLAPKMTPQLQAQFLQNLLTKLSGVDPINGVAFSSYLKAMCQFSMRTTFQGWAIVDPTTGPKPAYQVLGQLISGQS